MFPIYNLILLSEFATALMFTFSGVGLCKVLLAGILCSMACWDILEVDIGAQCENGPKSGVENMIFFYEIMVPSFS